MAGRPNPEGSGAAGRGRAGTPWPRPSPPSWRAVARLVSPTPRAGGPGRGWGVHPHRTSGWWVSWPRDREGEREKLLRLDEVLHRRVVGQDEAVRLVAAAV